MKRISNKKSYCEDSDNSDLEVKKRQKSYEESSDSENGESDYKSESEMEIKLNRTSNLGIAEKDDSSIFETGQIISIYCEDFMCHRKLSIEFGKQLNFINGENGSGKSAIVAALQLCLGANAKITHRSDNLRGMIRQGNI